MALAATAAFVRGRVRGFPYMVDYMLDLVLGCWPLIVARELGAYFVIYFCGNSGQLDKNDCLTAFVHVDTVGESSAA